MSLLFTKVTVTDSEDGAEFLVRGIPRSIEDLRGYTAFEEFLDGICLDDDITVYCAPYTYGEGEPVVATLEELAYLTMRWTPDKEAFDARCFDYEVYHFEHRHTVDNRQVIPFGDEGEINIPTEPIDCSKLGYFDSMEDECWDLIRSYASRFGIILLPNEDGEVPVNYDLAKRIQETILNEFIMAGVEFKFDENQSQINTDAVKEAIRNMNEDDLFDENIFGYETIDEVFHYFYDEEVSKGEIVDKLTPSQKLDLVSEYMGDRILKFDGKFYVNNESFGSLDTDYYINGGHSGDISM